MADRKVQQTPCDDCQDLKKCIRENKVIDVTAWDPSDMTRHYLVSPFHVCMKYVDKFREEAKE